MPGVESTARSPIDYISARLRSEAQKLGFSIPSYIAQLIFHEGRYMDQQQLRLLPKKTLPLPITAWYSWGPSSINVVEQGLMGHDPVEEASQEQHRDTGSPFPILFKVDSYLQVETYKSLLVRDPSGFQVIDKALEDLEKLPKVWESPFRIRLACLGAQRYKDYHQASEL